MHPHAGPNSLQEIIAPVLQTTVGWSYSCPILARSIKKRSRSTNPNFLQEPVYGNPAAKRLPSQHIFRT